MNNRRPLGLILVLVPLFLSSVNVAADAQQQKTDKAASPSTDTRFFRKEVRNMPRIPYKPHDNAGPEEIVAPIRARRGGTLLNLDRMLLHSPAYAMGWNGFLRTVRNELSLSPKLRELAVCGVVMLNGAEYGFHHHAPEFVRAGGTEAQVRALRDFEAAANNTALFDAAERAVMQLTVEMTRNVQVSDAAFAAVKAALPDEQQVVELVGVIATYNMVSRFLVALGVEPE
jgi:alkylhydroperoxidase family enzyme